MLFISKSERFFILILVIFGLFYTGLSYYKKTSPASEPASINIDERRALIDINTATQIQLERLPGIGPALAEKIITYREGAGGFGNIEELKNIKGVGSAKFENVKDLITLSE